MMGLWLTLCYSEGWKPLTLLPWSRFWYLPEGDEGWPLVGEFSFDYDEPKGGRGAKKLEQYPAKSVEGANRLFAALQGQAGWFDPNGTTKTAFALEVL